MQQSMNKVKEQTLVTKNYTNCFVCNFSQQ